MELLCKLKGIQKGGSAIRWSRFLKLFLELGGTVRRVTGSVHTFFLQTRVATYSERIDKPHPGNRLGDRVYEIRDALFSSFGLDLAKLKPVVSLQ